MLLVLVMLPLVVVVVVLQGQLPAPGKGDGSPSTARAGVTDVEPMVGSEAKTISQGLAICTEHISWHEVGRGGRGEEPRDPFP